MTAEAQVGRRPTAVGSPWLMLSMATLGFAVNFWAWALLSPLGPLFRDKGTLGALSESDVALLVAVPVIVGSLGRIVVGALTDRYGGRVMFPLVSAATIVPVLFIAFFAQTSYVALLVGGFFLGIGGTAFALTPRLREHYTSGDDEELEYAAMTEAARASHSRRRRCSCSPATSGCSTLTATWRPSRSSIAA